MLKRVEMLSLMGMAERVSTKVYRGPSEATSHVGRRVLSSAFFHGFDDLAVHGATEMHNQGKRSFPML